MKGIIAFGSVVVVMLLALGLVRYLSKYYHIEINDRDLFQ